MEDNKSLVFSDVDKIGDIEKDIPGNVEKVNSEDTVVSEKPLSVKSDLYRGILYTVVPNDFDFEQDLTPDIQGFDTKYVLLWDDYSSLFKFKPEMWTKIKVVIPKDLLGHTVFKFLGDVYSTDTVKSSWISKQEYPPKYIE